MVKISCQGQLALLDSSQISDISAVTSEDTFERPIYAETVLQL